MKYQNIKGTDDLLADKLKRYNYIKELFRETCLNYDFQEIETPVMEKLEVFKRENDTSDMVNKEMYIFGDDHDLVLRPEGTAGVIRSFVQHKLYTLEMPVKLFYMGKMYRKERPQKGRSREFCQLGIEVLGDKQPIVDAEAIALADHFLKRLGLKQFKVNINTIGDKETRKNYTEALIAYFNKHVEHLSEDSKYRLKHNPLRILDSKLDFEQEIINQAPKIIDYLSETSKQYFEAVCSYLKALNIDYDINHKLVRGLDYYSEVVFEFISTNQASGAQNALLGGGRYDELVSYFEGPKLSGIGFSMGLERIMILMELENIDPIKESRLDFYVIDLVNSDPYVLKVVQTLRQHNFTVDYNVYPRKLKNQFKTVARKNARYVLVIGEDELNQNLVNFKDVDTQNQKLVTLEEVITNIKKNI